MTEVELLVAKAQVYLDIDGLVPVDITAQLMELGIYFDTEEDNT